MATADIRVICSADVLLGLQDSPEGFWKMCYYSSDEDSSSLYRMFMCRTKVLDGGSTDGFFLCFWIIFPMH